MKIVFRTLDTTDFQTIVFKIKHVRLPNALCCYFLEFTSLAPLVAIFSISIHFESYSSLINLLFYRFVDLETSSIEFMLDTAFLFAIYFSKLLIKQHELLKNPATSMPVTDIGD